MAYGGGKTMCLTGARFTMGATLLHQWDNYTPPEGDIDLDQYGQWVDSQDPLTGEIIRVWKPYTDEHVTDPVKPDNKLDIGNINCVARGIVDGGIRVAGTTERFGYTYDNVDYVHMWVPSNVLISKRDKVTNIRDPKGKVLWVDEELVDPRTVAVPRATVFNVNGVTPLLDAFNRHSENFILLEKASVLDEG